MWQLSFRDDVRLSDEPDGTVRLEAPHFKWSIKKLSPGMRAVFALLRAGHVPEAQLLEQVSALNGPNGVITLYQYLQRLSRLLCYTLPWHDQALATLEPFAPPSGYQFQHELVQQEQRYSLSRFAYMRKDETSQLVVESLLGQAKVLLHQPIVGALLAALAQPHSPAELAAVLEWPAYMGAAFVNLLLNAQIVAAVDPAGQPPEATDTALAQWEFPDLLFHKHSRMGWKDQPYGGTYRAQGRFTPEPFMKPDLPTEIIPLARPDLAQLAQTDPSFTTVVEQRRSLRQYDDVPLTLEQLGEFLYRVAAVRGVVRMDGTGESYTRRAYPAGGSLYELEIYPVVNGCPGLPAGLYYYNPFEHQLHQMATRTPQVQALLDLAWVAASQQSQPQVLLCLTARFQVLQWKYESVAYSLIMKHVGVLQQTMYLVATAMGLAPCALGGGNSELFAQAAGLQPYAETSVGEFLLGSRKRA